MSWCWLALSDPPTARGAFASAVARTLDGKPAGVLQAWPAGERPVRHAVKADARVVDPAGAPARVSLVLLPEHGAPLYDDPAVSQAIRDVLAGPVPAAMTTLVRDGVHLAGALTARRDGNDLTGDPFVRFGPARLLDVEGGLLGRVPMPCGPVMQRYAGQPWPAEGFG